MFETIILGFAYVFGLAARRVGLPPLVGFLAAGFAVHLAGPALGLPEATGPILHQVAHWGVLLLLFSVGLKLNLRQIAQGHVIGTALVHFALSVALGLPLAMALGFDAAGALLLAVALSFSSTVLAAKMLESKRELGSFHGRTAIGILVVQDILALAVLAIWEGQAPNLWALALLGLPLVRLGLHRALAWAGHDELLVILGMLGALVVGGAGFAAMGLSSEIGALVAGLMLAGHPRAKELGHSMWALKEVFLVGFFLEIGLAGMPDAQALGFALAAGVLLPVKGVLFFALLTAFGLRARSAFLAGLSLSAYSEFGLILGAALMPGQVAGLALALALSFVIAAPLNRAAHPLFERFEGTLSHWQRRTRHPDEEPRSLGRADVAVFGMGRTGSAAYDRLTDEGLVPVGLDADPFKARAHVAEGRNVLFADAEDVNFWREVDLGHVRAAVLAMDDLEAKLNAARNLRARGLTGPIVAHALHHDQQALLTEAGADCVYLTMTQAGIGLADRMQQALSI
ncbi:MAG: cation:proton antiporter [Rhodobacteraceae bacterium]|nr:cation:proton antiporter [Paracoccaceae bacterium]